MATAGWARLLKQLTKAVVFSTVGPNALKLKNELEAAKAEAEKIVVAARGEAEANKILQMSITPQLIQKMWVEKWNGEMPKVVGSGGNVMSMIDVK